MKLERIALVISIITGIIGSIVGIYPLDKPSSNLKAYVSDNIFYTPPQYNKLMMKSLDESSYGKIYDLVYEISKESSFDDRNKVVKGLIKSIQIPFESPFQNGIEEYRKLVVVVLNNTGDATAKDIYIDYPEQMLTMIQDDKDDKIDMPVPITRITIPSIRQGGVYKIWTWSKNNNFKKHTIRIGTDNEITKIEYGELHFGTASRVATIYEEYQRIIITIIITIISFLSIILFYLLFNKICQILKSSE